MTYLDDIVLQIASLSRPGDVLLGMLAGEQHGVVARWQLYMLGFTANQIAARVRSGRLIRLHSGVYAVGHDRLSARGRWLAAVLACGTEAVLSHRAALALWDLRPIPSGAIDVTIPGRSRRGRAGIRVHNVHSLHEHDRALIDAIPVTSLPRALLDFAEVAGFQQLRLVLEEAVRREMLDDAKLERTLSRGRGRRGLKPLRAAIAEMRGPAQWTQSELERQFLALVRAAGLPEPSANVIVEGFLVDLWWPEARLAVEIDGYAFHKTGENGRQTLSAGAGSCGVGGRSLADECPQRAALPPPRGLVPATCSS